MLNSMLRWFRWCGPLCLCILVAGSARGVVKSWSAGYGDWSGVANWSPVGAPQNGDIVRLGDLLGVDNSTVTLDQDSVIDGLQISDGMLLNTAGNRVLVLGDTTISGQNHEPPFIHPSRLYIDRGVGPDDFDTDNLTVSNEAWVQFENGGILEIDETMSVDSTSLVYGNGVIRLIGSSGPSFVMDGFLDPRVDTGIVIDQLGTGRIDLDGATGNGEVRLTRASAGYTAFATLTINGDTLHDAFDGDMRLIRGAELNMNLTDGWTLGVGGKIDFLGSQEASTPYSMINGGPVTLNGEINTTLQSSRGRFNSDATLSSLVDVDLNEFSQLRFHGETTIEGGTYTLGEGAQLHFSGPTEISGGFFTTHSNDVSDGVVVFGGSSTWDGHVVINGAGRQDTQASVQSPSTIQAGTFDLDGFLGITTWGIEQPLTIQAAAIDSVDNNFNGTINFGPNVLADLTIQLDNPADSWHMQGVLNLDGHAALSVTRLAGSPVEMNGTVNMANNRVSIWSNTVFGSQNDVTYAGASSVLSMHSETRIEAGASFLGVGTLRNAPSGNMLLEHGAGVGHLLLNTGDLSIGDTIGQAGVTHFEQASSGTLHLDIAGTVAGVDHDRLTAAGIITLNGGTLDLMPDAALYQDPALAGEYDEFHLMTAGALFGQFDDVWYDATQLVWDFVAGDTLRSHEADGLFRIVEYSAEDLFLINYQALPGDANGDGHVDAQDFLIWNANKFTVGTDWTTGDFTGDGITDGADFTLWNAHKFTSVGFGASPVPEPSAGLLGLWGLILIFRRRRPGPCCPVD